jgi:hypothetical protein
MNAGWSIVIVVVVVVNVFRVFDTPPSQLATMGMP